MNIRKMTLLLLALLWGLSACSAESTSEQAANLPPDSPVVLVYHVPT